MVTVEIYQPRRLSQFLDDDNKEFVDELGKKIRDIGYEIEASDITSELFGKMYQLVGVEELERQDRDSPEKYAGRIVELWQNGGSGETSELFRKQNMREIAVSMSAGDIVRVDGDMFFLDSMGFSKIKEMSYS